MTVEIGSGEPHDGPTVRALPPDRGEAVVEVLCDAFRDYPVMRYVIGPAGADFDRRLERLIGFFVAARVMRGEPMLGITDGDVMTAVAIMTPPGSRDAPPELGALRETVWRELGAAARARYEGLGERWREVAVAAPNLHLNMIGVRNGCAGRGFGRMLLETVHEISAADPASTGVTLTTEDPDNVAWYQRTGYRIVGHVRITDDLESWGFYRPDDGG